jgi:hypothetical protein
VKVREEFQFLWVILRRLDALERKDGLNWGFKLTIEGDRVYLAEQQTVAEPKNFHAVLYLRELKKKNHNRTNSCTQPLTEKTNKEKRRL